MHGLPMKYPVIYEFVSEGSIRIVHKAIVEAITKKEANIKLKEMLQEEICIVEAYSFFDDPEKMSDFQAFTKEEFLDFYSCIAEEDYALTLAEDKALRDIIHNKT